MATTGRSPRRKPTCFSHFLLASHILGVTLWGAYGICVRKARLSMRTDEELSRHRLSRQGAQGAVQGQPGLLRQRRSGGA